MKRLTAILLVIALIISACAAPAGAGGSESGEPGSQTEESSLLGEEGFVPAEEPKEEAAEEPAAEELHEVSEESDDSEPDIIESDTMQETEESKPRLVILEENGDDYRSAAGLKTSDIDKKTAAKLRQNRSKTTLSWCILWDRTWRAGSEPRQMI